MVKQFIVTLMNHSGLKTLVVNCDNTFSAKCIAEGLYDGCRVIDIAEK